MLDSVFLSHAVLWFIGALSLVSVVGVVAAFWSMGRSAYRKD